MDSHFILRALETQNSESEGVYFMILWRWYQLRVAGMLTEDRCCCCCWDTGLLCSPGLPGTCYVDQTGHSQRSTYFCYLNTGVSHCAWITFILFYFGSQNMYIYPFPPSPHCLRNQKGTILVIYILPSDIYICPFLNRVCMYSPVSGPVYFKVYQAHGLVVSAGH